MFLASDAPISPNTNGPYDDFWYHPAGTISTTGMRVGPEQARRLAAVYACVKVISESTAMLPAILYRRVDERTKQRAIEHPLYNLLRRRPNAWMTSMEWRELMQAHALLRGNAYSEIVVADNGAIEALLPLHPDCMKPEILGPGRFRWRYNDKRSGQERLLLREEVFHLRGLSSDGILGLNPIEEQRDTIGMGLAAQDYGARYFKNDATPPGWIEHPAHFKDDESATKFRESWQASQSGRNRGKTAVLQWGMKYHTIEVKNTDAQFVESRKFSVEEICRIFRVPPHKVQNLDKATFCLPAGTQVLTDLGPKSVEEVKPGDIVWSREATSWAKARVNAATCSGEDEILKIKTTNRMLRANARHRVLVRRKYRLQRHHGGGPYVEWKTEYVPAGELNVGDTVVTAGRLPEGGSQQSPTRQASLGLMEFCGLLLGDGNVYPDWGVSIARASDAPYMDHYRAVIRSEFRRYDGGNGRGDMTIVALAPVSLTEHERQTKFASVSAARELQRLGLAGNARSKSVPGWIFGMDEARRLAFLRGFLDADGSVDKKGRINFSSCNERLLSQMRHLCIACGIPVTNLRQQVGITTLPTGRRAPFAQWTFTCSDPGANRRIGSHDPRYIERLKAGRPFDRKGRNYPRHGGRGFAEEGIELSRITAIECEPAEPVYDLEVEGTYNFVADGVVVHNSNIEHLGIEFVTDTLMPWLVRWEQAIDRDLLPDESEDDLFVEFLVDALLRGDIKSRYDAYRSGIQAGWLTRNEARVKENMDPLEGLDEPLEPLNMGRAGDARPDGQRSTDGADDQTADDSQAPTEQHGRAQILARAAAERVIRGEVAAMRKAYAVAIGDPESFPDAVEKFYAEHADYVAIVMLCDRITARDWCDRQSAAILRAADVEIEQQQPMVPALLEAWSETSADELAAFVEGTRRVDTLPALIERQTEAQVKRLTETVAAGFDRLATTSNDTARVLGAVGGGVERLGETLRETAERQIAQMKVTGEAITSVGNHAQASGELQSAKLDQVRNDIQAGQAQITDGLARVAAEIARPSKPVFDDKGNVIGVKKVDSLDR